MGLTRKPVIGEEVDTTTRAGTSTGPFIGVRNMTTKTVKLTLVGLDGNAFSLMGAFQKAAKRQG